MKIINLIKENSILILILLLATFLRFYHLDFQSIWLDEIHTLKETDPELPFKEFVSVIQFREGMGHFYFLIIRILNEIFSYSTYTARMFSAVIGVLSVFYIYKLGKIIFNKETGLIAAALLSINWFAILYSQEARPYILLMFLVILSYYRLIVFLKTKSIKNAIIYGIICGLVFNSHAIGLLSIFSQYLLLMFLFLIISKNEKLDFFKKGIIIFLVALFFSIPMYQMLIKMSKYKSGWLQLPGPDGFSQIFNQFLGNTELLYFIFISIIIFYIINVFNQKEIKLNYNNLLDNKLIFSAIILITWFFFPILLAIIKSYSSEPMILNRYFITLVPALLITIAIGIDLIKNSISKILIIMVIISFSLMDLIFIKDFYNKVTKTEFREVSNQIIKRNKNNDKIVSTYGWLMSYFFDKDKNSKPTIEMPFTTYVNSLRTNINPLESFWFMDGNSLPYNLSQEDEKFLNENFNMDINIERIDVWARHYTSKSIPSNKDVNYKNFGIKDFTPKVNDGNGNMMFFENSSVISSKILLFPGKYKLIINGNSLPEKPIKGINAHLKIRMNGKSISEINLSEKESNKENHIDFEIKKEGNFKFQITFDNDLSINGLDRNAIIYDIKISKNLK